MLTSTPIFDGEGWIILVVTYACDITVLYRLQQRLQREMETEQKQLCELESIRRQTTDSLAITAVDGKTLELLFWANKAAHTDTSVLLLGEHGVGKENFAAYIHKNSARWVGRFFRVEVDCAAAPHLLEIELFGCGPGAFGGSEGRMGVLEAADKGTVFWDRIDGLAADLQVKLLRVFPQPPVTTWKCW